MIEYREIDYLGTKIKVSKNGDIIWNNKQRNIRYNADGYVVCSIKTVDGWRSVSVARLVALAYIPNPDNLPEVNHKDYNRKNANVCNLEWISRIDNVRYSICNKPNTKGRLNPNYGNNKLHQKYQQDKELAKIKQGRPGLQNGRCKKIQLLKNGIIIKEFDYIVECCNYLNDYFNTNLAIRNIRSSIDKAVRNHRQYKGFDFVKI